jgi:hypothetical protein
MYKLLKNDSDHHVVISINNSYIRDIEMTHTNEVMTGTKKQVLQYCDDNEIDPDIW